MELAVHAIEDPADDERDKGEDEKMNSKEVELLFEPVFQSGAHEGHNGRRRRDAQIIEERSSIMLSGSHAFASRLSTL